MIVAGFGCRKGANQDSLADALASARGPHDVDALATLQAKSAHLRPFSNALALPLILIPDEQAVRAKTLTQSAASQSAFKTGSVAEAAALLAAGPGAQLLGPRHISSDRCATCALAIAQPQGEPT